MTRRCPRCCIEASLAVGGLKRGSLGAVGLLPVYGVKLHLLCATNWVSLSYELTAPKRR